MKKILLAVLMLGLSIFSTLSKAETQAHLKNRLLGKWMCVMTDDRSKKVVATSILDFEENGKIYNKSVLFDTTFPQITLTFEVKDQGKWYLSGKSLIINNDLTKREVSIENSPKTLSLLRQKEFQPISEHEKTIFQMLSNKDEDGLVVFEIDFKYDYFRIKQHIEGISYEGSCLPIGK